MTDKELLELAAKAAEIDRFQTSDSGAGFFWNPLTDDGDALHLAVKLSLNVCSDKDNLGTGVMDPSEKIRIFEPHSEDSYASTRRAIVRAAAAIGETL